MSKQIFKSIVPKELLITLLDKICEKNDKGGYLLDANSYKRMKFHGLHTPFLEELIEHYHWSKRFYIEREFTYQSFMTIVRQLCRLHSLMIDSTVRYGDSTYAIEYAIEVEVSESK